MPGKARLVSRPSLARCSPATLLPRPCWKALPQPADRQLTGRRPGADLAVAGERGGDLAAAVDDEPGEDLADVEFHGLDADVEVMGDLPVRLPGRDRRRDSELPGSQQQPAGRWNRGLAAELGVALRKERSGTECGERGAGRDKLPGRRATLAGPAQRPAVLEAGECLLERHAQPGEVPGTFGEAGLGGILLAPGGGKLTADPGSRRERGSPGHAAGRPPRRGAARLRLRPAYRSAPELQA